MHQWQASKISLLAFVVKLCSYLQCTVLLSRPCIRFWLARQPAVREGLVTTLGRKLYLHRPDPRHALSWQMEAVKQDLIDLASVRSDAALAA